ncbi:MAG TPA: response regulator [Bryobacteraceae bacterium]|nr:response regulator [Bryobacteraceae bacterium]
MSESGHNNVTNTTTSSSGGGDTPTEAQTTARPYASERLWIVLVEDNPGDVRLVREAFYESALEYDLTVLSDGEKAIRLIERIDREEISCPDLLLLDIGLPRKGGFQVLERARQSGRCAHLPVVILTSSNAQKDRETAAKLGATRYIRKPDRWEGYLQLGSVFREVLAAGRDGDGRR